jgi:hypothetical protein
MPAKMFSFGFASLGYVAQQQGDQIGRNFAIWAIFYGVGQIFF